MSSRHASRLPTRRRFLTTSAVIAGGLLGARSAASFGQADGSGLVDAHSHIWTRDVQRYPLAPGTTVDDLAPPSFTAEELLDTARPRGVRRVVLIAHHLYYGFDNRYMTETAAEHPGTFKVVGMVDDRQAGADEKMKQLLAEHVTGFRITPAIRGEQSWLDNDGMRSMWSCAAQTGQAMCCLMNPNNLPQVSNMCQAFPETPVVIDHFARIGVDGKIRDSDLKQLTDLARFPRVYVKVSAYYALGKKQPPYTDLLPMLKRVFEAFGAQRLMWASDAPYQLVGQHTYAASLALIKDHADFLTADDRDWLLRRTAENVYFAT